MTAVTPAVVQADPVPGPCPFWCQMKPGHGWDHDHDEIPGAVVRYHQMHHGNPGVAAVLAQSETVMPDGTVVLGSLRVYDPEDDGPFNARQAVSKGIELGALSSNLLFAAGTAAAAEEKCPDWCTDTDCGGKHWHEVNNVVPTEGHGSGPDFIGVYAHFDREHLDGHRPLDDMDPRPHVLVHVFGEEGAIDTDARFTPTDARELAANPITAADLIDNEAKTAVVS